MTAPRIDSLRNRIAGTIELLLMAHEELEDLHVLAYDRPAAVEEAKVAGGSSHYYLDTHGDTQAKDAYRDLSRVLDGTCTHLAERCNNALNKLRDGKTPAATRAPRHLRLLELGEAIANQAKRTRSGDYSPVRRGAQPDLSKTLTEMTAARDRLQRQLDRVTKERDRALTELRSRRDTRRAG